jgi:hypothetical protein
MSPHLAAIVKRPPLTLEQQAEHAKMWHRFASRPMTTDLDRLRITGKHVHDYQMLPGRALDARSQCGATMGRVS